MNTQKEKPHKNLNALYHTGYMRDKQHTIVMSIQPAWWTTPRSAEDVIALLHSEVPKELQAYQLENPATMKEELSNAVVRVIDCGNHKAFDAVARRLAEATYKKNSFVQVWCQELLAKAKTP